MAYGIMRCEKRSGGHNITGIEMEANRGDEKINFRASDIDWDRTKNNIHLVRCDGWKERISEEVAKHGCKIKSNSVLLIDTIFTASKEFFTDTDTDTQMQYFKDCLNFAQQNYGEVINAVIHLDEATPHMHIASIPLIERNDGKYSLSAKDIMGTKTAYYKRQDAFYDQVSSKYDLDRGERHSIENKRDHLDTIDYKIQQRELEIQKMEEQKVDLEGQITEHIEILAETKEKISLGDTIKSTIDDIKAKIHTITQTVLGPIKSAFERLVDKIEHRDVITSVTLDNTGCKMAIIHNDDSHTYTSPIFNTGEYLTWHDEKPIYSAENAVIYTPVGLMTADGHIDTVNDDKTWSEHFNDQTRDDIDLPIENDMIEIQSMLDALEDTVSEMEENDVDLNED